MVLENKAYVPTLAIRASEMNGLEFLPGATKDLMVPCFLLAPWANSHRLENSIARIERAFPNRPYFLDIDRDYEFTNLENTCQQELASLLDPEDAFSNWCEFVGQHEKIWPCIQSRGQDEGQIRYQIQRFQDLGRPYAMRVVSTRFPENFDEIVAAFASSGAADFSIILEGGWTTDALSLAVWFSGILNGSLQAIDATVPVVVSCTSIPKMFSRFNSLQPVGVSFNNRELLQQIAQGSNRARVIYGDWGSTRPRDVGGFATRPLDRIDYPTESAWLISRNKDQSWDFQAAAEATILSPDWQGNLGIWGEEMILNTTISPEIGIDTPQKNVAARVNIHLHRQAFFGAGNMGGINLDEEWQD